MLQYVSEPHSPLRMDSIPLDVYIPLCVSVHLLMDT